MARKLQVIAKGEDLGNGFCVVQVDWLPAPLDLVVRKHCLSQNNKCVIDSKFVDRPWHADAVYSLDMRTMYTAEDL